MGGTLRILAFSADSRFVAFTSADGKDTPVAAIFPEYIYIVNTTTREVAETIRIGVFMVLEGNTDPKAGQKAGEQHEAELTAAYARLEAEGYCFEVVEKPLPPDVLVDYSDELIEEGTYRYRLSFFLTHAPTGVRLDVGTAIAEQNDSKSRHEGEEVEETFFGPAWSTFTGETYATPDERSYIVFFRTPFLMEYATGERGALLITADNLSSLYNSVGFAYYKRADYETALAYFELSHFHNPDNPKAVYNMACMQALGGNVEEAIGHLETLDKLSGELAKQLRLQVERDSDFDRIRGDRRFSEFVTGAR